MRRDHVFLIRILLVVIGLFVSVAFATPHDNGGTNPGNLVFVRSNDDGGLEWFSQDLDDFLVTDMGSFGQNGWEALMAPWQTPGQYSKTTLRKTGLGQYVLAISDLPEELSLGQWSGRAILNVGRDINGNGTADALMVVPREKKLSWRLISDPFTSQRSFQRILFGRSSDIPFLFRIRGNRDSLAIIRRTLIFYRRPNSDFIRKIRLSGLRPLEAPKTLRLADGTDALLFSKITEKGLQVTTLTKRQLSESYFDPGGALVVFDLNGDGIQTFGVLGEGGAFRLGSGETLFLTSEGIPIGYAFQKTYEPSEISATPFSTQTPIRTPAISSTNTPETASPTSNTHTPTAITSATPIITAAPTRTETPTRTITNTPDVFNPYV
jgi:hypothetical protein